MDLAGVSGSILATGFLLLLLHVTNFSFFFMVRADISWYSIAFMLGQ